MTTLPAETSSFWLETSSIPTYPRLEGDLAVDVAIVGAGITGLTAAVLLLRAGKRVAVLEAQRVGHGVTGYTTAHLTEAVDTRYVTIAKDFGRDGARLVAAASKSALERIEHFVEELGIDAGLRRLPGYLFTESEDDLEALHDEHHAAAEAGVSCEMTREVPLPFPAVAAIAFPGQAELHAGRYVEALAKEVARLGGRIAEDTRVREVEDGSPCRVVTEHGVVTAKHVIEATNVPLNRVMLQTKLAHYRSYVIAASVGQPRLEGLFWDTAEPYHYLRSASTADGGSVLVVGGEDHKVGTEEETMQRYEKLVAYTRNRFAVQQIPHRWSAQIVETTDGLPFIGRNALDTNVLVATGYSGNGMTFGTAAAMLLTDLVLEKTNPWRDLFEPTRFKPIASAKDFVVNNAEVGLHAVGDWVRPADASSLDEVAPGEGKIVRVQGRRLAVYRDPNGAVRALSPVCTHLGCHVHFNDAEKSWDCPCHGSRFSTEGQILNGPAAKPLQAVSLDDVSPGAPARRG